MRGTKRGTALPKIIVSEAEQRSLIRLAEASAGRVPEIADALLAELERARVVKDGQVPASAVRMNSRVSFIYDDGNAREATLVYPHEANIAEGRISVMTPIGAALIGLSEGQSIPWIGPDGKTHRLTIVAVRSPEAVAG